MVSISRGLLMILVITALISCAQAATVYGTIYSWSDFDDLLLFPPTDPELEYLGDINLSSDMEIKGESNLTSYIILLLFLIAAVIALCFRPWKKKTPVSEDLHELYALIMKKGGRVTQKELRGEMKCSEAKVSLMLDDLEDRGYLKKIKKGRSNIIIAQSKK
ncbi:MAG: hypothetical protein LUQ20_07355 [Candidatus Methanoperedens sp.]|nr:hypothetical protein [Candidatus Methanoperedens sp.]